MELPDDAPKLPLLPFIIGDVIFLGVAGFLLARLGPATSTANVVAIIACAGLGVTCFIAPFLLSYTRKQDRLLAERQSALEALARTTSSAAEQASIAASGLHEIAEITKRNLHSLEELPKNIEAARQTAKSKEHHLHATAVEALRSDIDQLREEQSSSQETATQLLEKLVEQLNDLESRLMARVGDLETQLTSLPPAPANAAPVAAPPVPPASPPAEDSETAAAASAPEPEEPPAEPVGDATVANPPASDQPKKKTRKAPAKPPEPSLFDSVNEPAPAPPEPAADAETEPTPQPEVASDESPPEPSPSSDGLTRLTVTAYIGIGNRLFVRGDGPGLSREEGTPLQFVSIGKWRWETDTATAPVKLTVWKNDQQECTDLGEIELAPGAQLETSANF